MSKTKIDPIQKVAFFLKLTQQGLSSIDYMCNIYKAHTGLLSKSIAMDKLKELFDYLSIDGSTRLLPSEEIVLKKACIIQLSKEEGNLDALKQLIGIDLLNGNKLIYQSISLALEALSKEEGNVEALKQLIATLDDPFEVRIDPKIKVGLLGMNLFMLSNDAFNAMAIKQFLYAIDDHGNKNEAIQSLFSNLATQGKTDSIAMINSVLEELTVENNAREELAMQAFVENAHAIDSELSDDSDSSSSDSDLDESVELAGETEDA